MNDYPEDKKDCLAIAIGIARAQAGGGSDKSTANTLESVYNKLVNLMEDSHK